MARRLCRAATLVSWPMALAHFEVVAKRTQRGAMQHHRGAGGTHQDRLAAGFSGLYSTLVVITPTERRDKTARFLVISIEFQRLTKTWSPPGQPEGLS